MSTAGLPPYPPHDEPGPSAADRRVARELSGGAVAALGTLLVAALVATGVAVALLLIHTLAGSAGFGG